MLPTAGVVHAALMVALVLGAGMSASHAGPGLELHPNGAGPVIASVEAEVAVAGAFLTSPREDGEALDRAQALLDGSMFTRRDLGLVYTAAASLRLGGVQPDPITVAEDLKARGQLDAAGGFDLLSELIDAVPSAANVEYHAKIVRQKAAARTYRAALRTALRDVEQAERPLADILQEHRNRIDGMGGARGAQDVDAAVFSTLADLLARPELLKPPECVVPRLAYRGRLVILAGPDKSGKSTLLAHATAALSRGDRFLGEDIVARHHRGVVLGLEEAVGDGVRRFSELGAEGHRIQMVVIQEPNLLTRTKALLAAWPADLVVVDSLSEYARVTQGAVPEDGDTGAWAGIVRPLVALARECDVAVVVLHHVRRSDGQYRGSGEIAAAADAVLELAVPKPGEDPTVRRISGRGRWSVTPFEVALRDGRYELGGGAPLSLDARIILHVEQSPGMSGAQIRKAVGGRGTVVDETVRNLVERGALDERTDGRGSSFYPPSGQGELGVA